ncbi:Phage tail length tape-measure protein 1 [Pseudomonas synxantha]|uniref:Phage tail length tape-measure protein 1 n=1 Tax=Pseudomonas synxantha TaxID=47883 RepID=A0A3G7U2T2_9PSED|nr:phage tail tape measure protein [Pseudomonas synxantha]AZE53684.1 Phage tail length tape-measure protein 1 [Pseudomonas synxantha]
MTSIAELGIKVDSTDAAQASSDLDKLVAAGGRAEKAAERVAKGTDKASASIKKQRDELSDLLGEIDPTVKALGRLDDLEAKLAKHKGVGLDSATFSEYQAKIDQTRTNLTRFDDGLTRTGNTAKQTAAALRGVPAQLTDIAVSLQAGQAPLTVLLQQGGQLKDMFGGVAPAAKALGGYVLGLVNPFTIAAAAVAALGLAYYKGSEEADSYSEALIFTGNVAGASASQLAAMAQQVSSTIGTTGAASEVLAKLAGNGKIASGSFEQITEAALQMERATGRSIDETIAEFAKIAKDPVAAAKELNDQYHFLTASVYAQIAALKEQGDTVGAANLLTDTYASTIATRTGQITQNLGLIERGWNSIRDAAKAALDIPLSIGREKGLADQLADERAKLADLEKKSGNGIVASSAAVKKEREDLQASIRLKEAYIEIEKRQNKYLGDRQKIQDKGIEAEQDLERIRVASYSNKQKRDKEEEAYLRKIAALREANPNSPLLNQKNIDRDLANIRDKYKDPKGATGSVDLTSFNDSKNQLNAVLSYYKSADKELEAAQKAGIISQESYTAQRVALLQQQASEVKSSYESEIAALEGAKGKASTSAAQRIQLDQKIADARANMVKAQQESDSELAVIATNEQGRLKKQELAIKSYTDAMDQQNAALQRAGSRAAQGVGQGDRQNTINGDLNGISDRANQQRLDLARDKADASRNMSAEEYQAKLEAINRSERDLTQTTLSNYEQMSVAQSDWRNGATSAFSNYLDSARDVAGQTRSLFTNAFSSMEDAVASFATNGKFSFSDFAKSIIADMARIATRQAASGLLSSLAGTAIGAWFGGGAAAGAGAGSFGSSIGSAITANAKGGVYDSPSLSSFSNQVHDKPQMFAFAKGAGIFAEAGPEAIMPLTRTAGGELGVRALGGGGGGAGGGNTYNFPVSVSVQTAGDGGNATQEDTTQLGKGIQQAAKTEAETAISKGLQPGGSIWRLINGR